MQLLPGKRQALQAGGQVTVPTHPTEPHATEQPQEVWQSTSGQAPFPQRTVHIPVPQVIFPVHPGADPQPMSHAVALEQSMAPQLPMQVTLQASPAGQVHPETQDVIWQTPLLHPPLHTAGQGPRSGGF